MKNWILVVGVVIFIIAIVAGAISSIGSSDPKQSTPLMGRTQDWSHSYPQITSDGMSVMVDGRTILTVPNKAMSDKKIAFRGISDADKKSTLKIEVDGKTVTHSASEIQSPLWCEARSAFYFIQSAGDRKQVWQWNKESGFSAISKTYDSLSDLTISPDAKVIAAQVESSAYSGSTNYVVRSLTDSREKVVSYPDSSENMVPLSMREGLIDGHNKLGNQTYRWRFDSENVTPLFHDANMVSVTCIDGSFYGVHKRNRDFEVVHLNPKLDGWTDSYSIPGKARRKVLPSEDD